MESTNLDLLNFGITGLRTNYNSSQYIFVLLLSLIHQGQIKLIKSDSIRHVSFVFQINAAFNHQIIYQFSLGINNFIIDNNNYNNK